METSPTSINIRGRAVILGLAALLWIVQSAYAQTFEWAQLAGGSATGTSTVPETDRIVKMVSDGSNFVYVTGSFKGQAQFGSTTLTGAGDRDVFLARYRADGKIDWARAIGGPEADDGFGVASDGAGTVCVTGDFVGTADFGGVSLTSYGGRDVFLACFSQNGTLKWVRQAGSSTAFSNSNWSDYGTSLAFGPDGAIYVTGEFRGKANFDGMSITSRGYSDGFLAKYDGTGSILWVNRVGGIYDDDGNAVAVDPNGDVILTGFFTASADFGSLNLNGFGSWDIYVSKWSPSGSVIWARGAGGPLNDRGGGGIAFDRHGDIYVTGYFKSTATFGDRSLTSIGERSGFVWKMASDGSPIWTVGVYGTGRALAADVAYSSTDHLYLTGSVEGGTLFGTLAGTTSNSQDVFAARLDPDGNFDWVKTAGSPAMDLGYALALNGPHLLISGQVAASPTFGSITLPFRGGTDAFLASIDLRPPPPVLASPEQDAAYISTSPNLVWSSVDLATRYDVQVASDPAFANIVYAENTPATHVAFTAPVAEHDYYWRVHGVGLAGPGEWSDVGHFTVGSAGPLAPQLTDPPDNASGVGTSVALEWLAAPEAEWHRIQVSSSQAFVSPEIDVDDLILAHTSFQAVGLAHETRYFWRVAGVSESGKSTWSAPWSFVTMEAAPDEVTLQSPAPGSEEVDAYTQFSWQEMAGADGYHLQVAKDEAFTILVVDDSTLTAPAYKMTTPLQYATEYHWRVRAHNAAGFGAWSPFSSFVVAVGTAIEDLEVVSSGLDLRGPGLVRISFGLPEAARTRVEVFDATGRLAAVLAEGFLHGENVVYWDARSVASGVYFLRLIAGGETVVKSFVVVR